jgi:hypothetical protein
MSNLETSGCPQCGTQTNLLHPIDQGLRLRLEKEGASVPFDTVCTSCFKSLSKNLSSASLLQAEQYIQGNYKKNLWKNRLALLREGRAHLERKEHADAAVCYEKYLKIIQYVYEKNFEQIEASLFKEHPREVTLICSALWSLVEIYDLHPNYTSKQESHAAKLGELLPYTNLFSNMAKQAHIKVRHAKNPQAYRILLRKANIKTGNCFIASIAFENRNDPTLIILRQFRNQVLITNRIGRHFVQAYYRFSPALANRLQHYSAPKRILRQLLPPFATALKVLFKLREM